MSKVIQKFETKYEKVDVVIFEKDGLKVWIIEGYYVDDGTFWFNIRISSSMVYTYSNKGDIGEYDIIGKVDGILKERCAEEIRELR